MSCKHPAIQHHRNAVQHYERAAHHHGEAARYFEAQDIAAATRHAHLAIGHASQAEQYADEACRAHARLNWE